MVWDYSGFNILTVLLAALAPFMIGFVWYGKALFADRWQKETGLTDKQLKNANMARTFTRSGLANIIMALVMIPIVAGLSFATSIIDGMMIGGVIGVGIVAMGMLTTYLFEQRSMVLWLIDAGYIVVNMMAMGAIIAWLA